MKNQQDIEVMVKCHFSETSSSSEDLLDAFIRVIMAELKTEKDNRSFDKSA